LVNGYATEQELNTIETTAAKTAKEARDAATKAYREDISGNFDSALSLIQQAARSSRQSDELLLLYQQLKQAVMPTHLNATSTMKKALRLLRFEQNAPKQAIKDWIERVGQENQHRFNSFAYCQGEQSATQVKAVAPIYAADAQLLDGREIVNYGFDAILARDPRVFIIGEDVGKIGDVNQTLHGLQDKYSDLRLTDTGIRETTIIGQGIGAAIRGLRPIVEIQYLDYILYPFATLSDDLASLHYRTVGGQKAPLIVRTRGHRLEGIWHSGSPMGLIINGLRGMMVCVPRNMTQAIGMYNTLLKADDPALVIESLNGYRLKEKLPDNISEICVALGQPEVLRQGTDLTLVTYGSMCRMALEASEQLKAVGIDVEVIDIQTLLPFDLGHTIVASIQKTNRLLVVDEDMPGGGSAYILQQILDEQQAYRWLDASPQTLAAKPHRPAYGSDGDYFSKPNLEDIFDAVYAIMHEANPSKNPY
jgi:pyruvate/2-oxoglutarate/acetoin dehydrogenase E1 component